MAQIEKLYTATATANGGRNGKVKSSDGVLELELRTPKEMGGPGGNFTNPEQLFAAGYAACFDSALNMIIRQEQVQVESTSVTAEVSIGKLAEGFGLAVVLSITIAGIEGELAEGLAKKAHAVCPYSNATRNNVEVTLKVGV